MEVWGGVSSSAVRRYSACWLFSLVRVTLFPVEMASARSVGSSRTVRSSLFGPKVSTVRP